MTWNIEDELAKAKKVYDDKVAEIRDMDQILQSLSSLAATWPDGKINHSDAVSRFVSLNLPIKPEDELGVAAEILARVEGECVRLGGQLGEMKDATNDWFIGKSMPVMWQKSPEDRWGSRLYLTIYVGRNHWIGQPDVEGAVCTRRQIGTKPERHTTYTTVEKPVFEIVCPGQPQ